MKIFTTNSSFNSISKSLLIGTSLFFMQSLPICATPVSIPARVVESTLDAGGNISNASLLGGAYFMILLVIGYVIKSYSDLRKSKHENAE
jgi:hypothetical protein